LKAERETALQKILMDKNKHIERLSLELKEIHEAMIKQFVTWEQLQAFEQKQSGDYAHHDKRELKTSFRSNHAALFTYRGRPAACSDAEDELGG
jgi:hypothetical protein